MKELLLKLAQLNISLEVQDSNLNIYDPDNALTEELLLAIKKSKSELLTLLVGVNREYGYVSIPNAEWKTYYPLTSAQRRLYILFRFDKKSTVYNMPTSVLLEGEIDKERLSAVFRTLIARHESLRTYFLEVNGEPYQRLENSINFEVEHIEQQGDSLKSIISAFRRPFDLGRAPLFRVGLTKAAPNEHLLMVDMHHIISDGISQGVLIRDFMALYNGEELPQLRLQYKDYAAWQHGDSQRKGLVKQKEFWVNEFSEQAKTLELPIDFQRSSIKKHEGSLVSFDITADETVALRAIAEQEGTTIFMVMFSIYSVLLAKLSNADDIVVGTPTAGRRHSDIESTIGMFVNTLPIRIFPRKELSYRELLISLTSNVLACLDNQDYPFEELLNDLSIERDPSHNPLFDVMFSFQEIENLEIATPGLLLKPFEDEHEISKFDLSLIALDTNNHIRLHLEYSTELFRKETVDRFVAYFKRIVSVIISDRNKRLSDIEILSDQEKQELLQDFNATSIEYPEGDTVLSLFDAQVKAFPNKRAVVFPVDVSTIYQQYDVELENGINPPRIIYEGLSYEQLDSKASMLAQYLINNGVQPNDIIGLMLEPSLEMILGIIGILKAGAAFLPISPDFPKSRIAFMLKDSGCSLLLTQEHLLNYITFDGIQIDIEDSNNYSNEITDSMPRLKPDDLLYIIYTSGTTGNPKGVMIKHANLVNYLNWFRSYTDICELDKTTLVTSFAFDLGYTSLFSSILAGAELHILPKEIYMSPSSLINYIHENGITYMKLTPLLYSTIVNNPNFVQESIKSLRIILLGGEKIRVEDVRRTYELSLGMRIINHYGPTETTIGCITHVIEPDKIDEYSKNPTIGKPIHNAKAYILDGNLNILPIGVAGQLCIAGKGLGIGYLNQPELTAEKFTGLNELIGERVYQTGDQAKFLADGTIAFIGRMDSQIKISGYRVEIGEIEQCIKDTGLADKAVVISRNDANENAYLCAYFKTNTGLQRNQNIALTQLSPIHLSNNLCELAHNEGAFFSTIEKLGKKSILLNGQSILAEEVCTITNRIALAINNSYNVQFSLSPREKVRYKRQALLKDWGVGGQEKLKSTKVFVAGAGGGASPTIMQLALAGFGTIVVCDFDVVELSNLNRQVLHDESRIGMNKALSAQQTIQRINPNVNVITITEKITRENALDLVGDCDMIFDMLDGQQDKFILSEVAVKKGIPHFISAMTDINSYAAVFHTPHTPCFHCVFDRSKLESLISGMKENRDDYQKDPLAVVATSLFQSSSFVVNEAIKYVLGFENLAYGKFFYINQRGTDKLSSSFSYQSMIFAYSDHFKSNCKAQGFDWESGGWRGKFLEELEIVKNPECPVCSSKAGELKLSTSENEIVKGVKAENIPVNLSKENCVALLFDDIKGIALSAIGTIVSGKTIVLLDTQEDKRLLSQKLDISNSRVIVTNTSGLKLAEGLRDAVNQNISIVDIDHLVDCGQVDLRESGVWYEGAAYFKLSGAAEPGVEHRCETFRDVLSFLLPFNGSNDELASFLRTNGVGSGERVLLELFNLFLSNNSVLDISHIRLGRDSLEQEFRDKLGQKLPPYMIPAYFVEVDEFPLTSNGKIDVKRLPAPSSKRTTKEVIPPKNSTEAILLDIWAAILGTDKSNISTSDNFFAIGGQSIKVIMLDNEIHRQFNKKISFSEIFSSPTIRSLAETLNKTKTSLYQSIESVERKQYYPLSSAQKRLYFLQMLDLNSITYNIPFVHLLDSKFDINLFEYSFKKLIDRHESFRTTFITINNEPVQRIRDDFEFKVDFIETTEEKLSSTINNCIRPFDLSNDVLLRANVISVPNKPKVLVVDTHHIISDGTSNMIASEDFFALLQGNILSPLKYQYKDFSQWQNRLLKTGEITHQENYWKELFAGEIPILQMPTDYKRPAFFTFEGDSHKFIIENKDAIRFKKLATDIGGTLYMSMLAALNVLLYKYTGQSDIIIGCGIAGRPHADLQRIAGMFINSLAMRNFPKGEKSFADFLNEVKNNCLKAFENQDVQFEDLVDALKLERDPSRNPLFDIDMVVQNFREVRSGGQLEDEITLNSTGSETDIFSARYRNTTSKFDMCFIVQEVDDYLRINLEYYTRLFKKETIVRFVSHFKRVVSEIVNNPNVKINEINILTNQEKDHLLFELNSTRAEYPKDSIVEMFQQQVEKMPDNIAVVYDDIQITYKHLDEKTNSLAGYLVSHKEMWKSERIGLLLDKSVDEIVSILGVLKAGGIYVPVAPSFPMERIQTIIEDTEIGLLISQKSYLRMLNQLQWECDVLNTYLCLDSNNIHLEKSVSDEELENEKKIWRYVGETSSDEITGGGWNSSYTGLPLSKEEMGEYRDNIFEKLKVLLHPKMRVLEIGCASGISMFRLAPHVSLYYGTDLSELIIKKNQQKIDDEGIKNVKVAALSAHEIDQLDEQGFDLIIMNSVIQSFYDYNYLREVLRKSTNLLNDKGLIFIGDIMDFDLKKSLEQDMIDFKRKNKGKEYKTKIDWSTELFVSKNFFNDLLAEFHEFNEVRFSDKIFTIENELTKYRYDAIIELDKTKKSVTQVRKIKNQHDLSHLLLNQYNYVGLKERKHLSYILYTSGTSGKPKGVMVKQDSIVNLLHWFNNTYDIKQNPNVLHLTDYTFDPSVEEIFATLLFGGVLHISNKNLALYHKEFHSKVNKWGINIINYVPSVLRELLCGEEKIKSLNVVISGGERLDEDIQSDLLSKGYNLYNNYGPTETTVDSVSMKCSSGSVAIGKPIANNQAYILTHDHLQLQPIGVAGELCVGGIGLAHGYLNSEDLTNSKFVKNPYLDNSLIYRTGDLAKWLPDGNIEFLGRIDEQVKIRGYRIELAEIENCLAKYPELKECAVIAIGEGDGKTICAYYVVEHDVESYELIDYLSKTLPSYMLPQHFVKVDKIPLTSNGKIDRKSLPSPMNVIRDDYQPPQNLIEQKLVKIWSEVLGVDENSISVTANFFELGGHSLRATTLVSKIHKELQVEFELRTVFQKQTVQEQARLIWGAGRREFIQIPKTEIKPHYQLSSAQKRLFILQQMDLNSTAYNTPTIVELKRDVDLKKVSDAFQKLISRHDSFRTSFIIVNDIPVQTVHDEVNFKVEEYVIENDKKAAFIESYIKPFDLTKAPLLRVAFVKIIGSTPILITDMHHIIGDGTSQAILEKEFNLLYNGQELEPLKLQYRDYSEWQNSEAHRLKVLEQENYWVNKFEGEIPVLNLPTDYVRPSIQSHAGATVRFILNKEESANLKLFSEKNGLTLYMSILSMFSILLSKLSGQEDIVVGTPIAGRSHADLEGIVGMFVNTLAIRNEVKGNDRISAFISRLKQSTLEAYENQDYQFEDLTEKISVNRDISRNPVFDVMLNILNQSEYAGTFDENVILKHEKGTSKFDMNLAAVDFSDKILLALEYSTSLFKEETINRMIQYFRNIAKKITTENDITIGELQIISEQEKAEILKISEGVENKFAKNKVIHDLFTEQVAKTPLNPALKFNEDILTYESLNKKSNQVASILRKKGVMPNDVVGLMIDRSFEMIVGVIGILKSGAAYLPIDINYPDERKKFMLEESGVEYILFADKDNSDSIDFHCGTESINLLSDLILNADDNNLENVNKETDLIYVIYTSGSTGKPKGVMLEHRNLVNLMFNNKNTNLVFNRVLQFASISFDVSFQEIFSTLLSGGTLVLISDDDRQDALKLAEVLRRESIETLFLPTSFAKYLFNKGEDLIAIPECIKHIITAGEQLVVSKQFSDYLRKNKIYLHNHYGPTETHVVTIATLSPNEEISEFPVIGRPIQNTTTYVLDTSGNMQPIGITGELYIGGVQVGRGYYNKPQYTLERFINDPFKSGGRLYKTGDLVRWLPDGNLEFIGRTDHQVKIRGFRIELGEIESVLIKYESIKECVVIAKEESGEKYLCAYLVSEIEINTETLREYLKTVLPDYMIPSYFITMDVLPLTKNGKINLKALPSPDLKVGEDYVSPSNETEEKLVRIWSEVLTIPEESISVTANFFSIGGHSLKATVLLLKMHKEFNIQVPLIEVFRKPTIKELALLINAILLVENTQVENNIEKERFVI